jgi:glyceraldehyde-3-phosphate dehydrogenase/erythrose-4-phosphate dehydrogenase
MIICCQLGAKKRMAKGIRYSAQVPWDVFGVDIVMECSGKFLTR